MTSKTSGIGRFQSLYGKEIRAYFDHPTAYVVAVVFLIITGYFFTQELFLTRQTDMRPFAELSSLLLVFFVPAVTMRLFAEERKSGTLELLMTLPVEDGEILFAKLFAAISLMTFTLAMTLVYPVSIEFLGRVDPGSAVGVYTGLILTGSLLASAGLFASSLTRNQVVAFIISFLIGFVLYSVGKATPYAPLWIAPLMNFLGIDSHLHGLARGIFDSRDLVYYLTGTALFAFLTYVRLQLARSD